MLKIGLKRAYDDPAGSDGERVLVDRIWPRGVARDDLRLGDWMKELAPSDGLRQWFGHDPDRWDEFQKRYIEELDSRADAVEQILAKCRAGTVTLIFGAKDTEHNNAVALKAYLERLADT